MKNIILILALFSFTAHASNWMTPSTIESKGVSGYSLQVECEKSGEKCFDIQDPEAVTQGFVLLEDDWGPETDLEECSDEVDCTSKLLKKICPGSSQKFIDQNYSKTYCVELLATNIKVNEKDLASYRASLLAKNQEKDLSNKKKDEIRKKLKDFDKSKLTTVAALRDFVAELVELLKE